MSCYDKKIYFYFVIILHTMMRPLHKTDLGARSVNVSVSVKSTNVDLNRRNQGRSQKFGLGRQKGLVD